MKSIYFSQKSFSPIEKPIQELMDLNVKTFQSFTYLTPVEILSVKKPEEILERNMDAFIKNSHKGLDYLQSMFSIMEKHWLDLSETVTHSTKQAMNQAQNSVRKNFTEALDAGERTSMKTMSTLKKSTAQNMKKAQSTLKKSVKAGTKAVKQGVKSAAAGTKKIVKASSSMSKSPVRKATSVSAAKKSVVKSTKKPVVKSAASKSTVSRSVKSTAKPAVRMDVKPSSTSTQKMSKPGVSQQEVKKPNDIMMNPSMNSMGTNIPRRP